MADIHQFGIIDCIEENKEYTYEPEKYNLISVDGELIDKIYHESFENKMKELNILDHNKFSIYWRKICIIRNYLIIL